ncbi:hypothetical protein KY331_04275 [Candidatus Woesearchaeota archaeon]|nr:hypothetical protein [Candidatus Woesearchaeota archaeon]
MTWQKLVERKGDFLKNHLLYENFNENFLYVHNRHHSNFLTIRKGNTFTHYVHKSSKEEFSKFLRDKISQNPQFMNEMLEKGKLHFRNLLNFSERIGDLSRLSNSEIKGLIAEYFKLYKLPYPYFNITIFTDKLEENKEVINMMADLRLLGRSSFNKTHKLIKPLFKEIGKRLGLNDVKFLKPKEILNLLDGENLGVENLIRNRQNCYFLFQQGKFILKENESFLVEEESTSELKGRGTFPSFYRGKVKVVKSKEDIIEKGDVIVLKMTTPDLISEAMKKAGAIITDEGGITCHAAVLSRELNIPTLIGTKIATKVLKDGDLVEVDTKKGIVKIVN